MHIYWKAWLKAPLTKAEADNLAADLRRLLARMQDERREFEKVAKKIDKAIG